MVKYFYDSPLSIIEAIRRNPDKHNDLLARNRSSSISTGTQDLPLSYIEDISDVILEEAKRAL